MCARALAVKHEVQWRDPEGRGAPSRLLHPPLRRPCVDDRPLLPPGGRGQPVAWHAEDGVGKSPSQEYIGSATAAGLRYVTDAMPGIRRRRHGRGFAYVDAQGCVIRQRETIRRLKSLVIPPAWTDVWICPAVDGHLQVTARDGRGRKQYRYHPGFRRRRDEVKFERMLALSDVLWKVRNRVEHDIALPGLPRDKIMATVVWLLERTLIRVGTDEYAKTNKSFGLTTLRRRHVAIEGLKVRFEFRGKSGVVHAVAVTDRRIVRIVQRCQELPGQELFQYLDDAGERQSVAAEDVNAYLRAITERDVTAKDFRTWAGTMLAASALREMGPAATKRDAERNVLRAIDRTAASLGNTRSVCRKYYIHPALIEAYLEGSVLGPEEDTPPRERSETTATLRKHEMEVLAFLRARVAEPSAEASNGVAGDGDHTPE
ncbi:MAG: DNA topoisomerase IB [Gemmatimonadaceae bacterium]